MMYIGTTFLYYITVFDESFTGLPFAGHLMKKLFSFV